MKKRNNTERTCSPDQQTKKTNKNKNMRKIEIAVQHVQTIDHEKKRSKANVYIEHYSEM